MTNGDLLEAIEERRNDRAFMQRLGRLVDENREILRKLSDERPAPTRPPDKGWKECG